ncbi:hypothetical protein BDZ45DRAFT_769297 [Acephala macrosclerotiorum]|nr:hypothetical protein BDZ45DRAFT_769297 [Acephala macrosclerotiorum]
MTSSTPNDTTAIGLTSTGDNTSTSSELGTSFKSFEKLPTELRLAIWWFALPGPRIIKLFADMKRPGEISPRIQTESSPPGMLRANTESRQIAQQAYKLFFTQQPNVKLQYVDWSKDTLYVQNVDTLRALLEPVWDKNTGEQAIQQQLRYLMLGEDVGERAYSYGFLLIRKFTRLKRISLAIDLDDESNTEDDRSILLKIIKYSASEKAICKHRPKVEHPEISIFTRSQMDQKFSVEQVGASHL